MLRTSFLRIIAGIAITVWLSAGSVFTQTTPSELFQRAQMLDEGNQNLAEALRLYDQVSTQTKDRALAAKARYRAGLIYQRLGQQADAQRAFRTVVSQYADQTDFAARARAKLGALGANGKKEPELLVTRFAPSPDGRFLATLSFPQRPGESLSRPAIDSTHHRLYIVIKRYRPLGNDAASKRAEHKGLRDFYEPSTLIVIDTETNSVIRTLRLPTFLGCIVFNPANNKLYGNAMADGEVRVIDVNTFAQTVIPVDALPGFIAVNATTNKVYVGSQGPPGKEKLFVIDGHTNTLSASLDLNGSSHWVVVNSATNRIYAATDEPSRTRVFDGSDNSFITDLRGVLVLEADPARNRLYAQGVNSLGLPASLQVLDGNTHSKIASFETTSGQVAINPAIDRLYAVLTFHQLAVFDGTTNTSVTRVYVRNPEGLTIDPTTGRLYLCYEQSNLGVLDKDALEQPSYEEWSDNFDQQTLDSAWQLMKGRGRGSYSLAENPGHLRLHATNRSTSSIVLFRSFQGDSWTFQTSVSFSMGTTGGGRSIAFAIMFGSPPTPGLAVPSDNWVAITRYRNDWTGCCAGMIGHWFVEGTTCCPGESEPTNSSDSYVWRVQRSGRTVTVERSDDGISFTVVGAHTFGAQIDGVVQYLAISSNAHTDNSAYADFDYVRLTKTPAN